MAFASVMCAIFSVHKRCGSVLVNTRRLEDEEADNRCD